MHNRPITHRERTETSRTNLAFGSTIAYRDGKPYGKAIQQGHMSYKKGDAQIVFGMRHGNGTARIAVDRIRIQTRN